ncbi:trafficking protein particle complex subunit 13-like [Salvia splendens]|uniref:trafficking protein particle complex subunit 13-like n=1 Tax=Salvia splendens TaxID=180675 RepID=UPI001C255E30|nr:trafficking protein particle complex subunit 13-like [Salvia splendens]
MSSGSSGGAGGQPATHSLAFRVMRLCRPTLHVDNSPLKFDPCDLLFGEDLFDDPIAASHLPRLLGGQSSAAAVDPADLSYRGRFLLQQPTDSLGLPGLLVLPQAFGAIYLGETFCSYISINNSSNFEVRDVVIKAEIQTERQRLLLLDSSKSPVESIRAGGRYDFIVEHDVKELGAHTLVCTALYTDGDNERKYLPQFFKFMVSNPLSVRTKVRNVKDTTFLEACIENHTKSDLYMDQVEFEPAQYWSATVLRAEYHSSEPSSVLSETFKEPILIKSGGGIYNYLYQLKFSSPDNAQFKAESSKILGKLQITWRTNLGEPGRLQTQHILGNPVTRKDIELHAVEMPSVIMLEKSFLVGLNLINLTDRVLGPFQVWVSEVGSPDEKAVVVNGLQTMTLGEVQPHSSLKFQLNLIAVKHGIQKISGITVYDTVEKKTYESLFEMEIYVDLE